ncbi:MAG: hypothetical protein KJP00_16270 [Bacteroidia bacterium]|nr:hypothetical protein [Bacteroidia bacterium]
MDGIDIVTLIAIILFARLGMRLVGFYIKAKKEQQDDEDTPNSSDR